MENKIRQNHIADRKLSDHDGPFPINFNKSVPYDEATYSVRPKVETRDDTISCFLSANDLLEIFATL
jgi:hypothetical protein